MWILKEKRCAESIAPHMSDFDVMCLRQPNGKPGYIRVDTVYLGGLDKQKGVYHINAVDEQTQFEVVTS